MRNIVTILLFQICVFLCTTAKVEKSDPEYLFRVENLVPWSIVGFDAKERTPKQRIQMLKRLGFSQYAYGNRPKQQASMKEELLLAKENNIKIRAVWLYINLSKDKTGQLKPHSEAIFKTIEEAGLQTQIWVGFDPKYFAELNNAEALKRTVNMIEYLAKRAKGLGCKIALYNHGGWFGESLNQVNIIKSLPKYDLGIVYNFHHAHENLDTFSKDLLLVKPYLWCVNLNGMKKKGPKIITIGEGNMEKQMIQQILDMGYKGPFGILDHVKGADSEIVLKNNVKGLQTLFP